MMKATPVQMRPRALCRQSFAWQRLPVTSYRHGPIAASTAPACPSRWQPPAAAENQEGIMMNQKRGAIGSLALAALLGATLAGAPGGSISAQEATPTATPQTEADAAAAALSTGKYPYGTELMLLNGQASVRNAAGSEAATLTEIDEGTTVTVLAGPEPVGGVDWYQVETEGGITGWIPSDQFGIAKGGPVLETGTEREIVADSMNLRAEAGTSGEVISGLAQGDTVTIVSGPEVVDDLDWYQVDTEFGEQGWLAGVYLGEPGSSTTTAAGAQTTETPVAETPTADATATPASTTAAAFPEGSYVFVNSDTLNLRADASIDAEIVSELVDGAIGTVTGAPVTAGDYDWYPVTFGTGDAAVSGWVAGSLITGGITVGSAAVVADGPLNLRDDSSVDGEPIAQLETGDAVTVIAGPSEVDGIAWFEVQSGDTNGYVAGRYLGPQSPE
jgi:uncharacterized protein YgiM (DUF1202 family)